MASEHKRPALTRIGDNFNRRAFFQRDANCPAVLIYRFGRGTPFSEIDVWISNICEGGALLLVEGLHDVIDDLYVVLPGLRAKIRGKAVRQGDFTVAVEFDKTLPSALVDRIAALEPIEGAKPRLSNAIRQIEASRKKSAVPSRND